MKQHELWDEPPKIKDGQIVLLDLQADFLERARIAYLAHKRVIWQAPCGAGKTVVAAEQTRRAVDKGKTVLHIVHRRRLVDQMIETLLKFGIYASPIMEGRSRWKSSVYCASRDTLLSMLKSGADLPREDLIIWDECHVQSALLQEWYLKNCPQAYWTGYTATPIRVDGKSLNPPYEALVSMAPTSELLKIGRLCPVKAYNPDHIGQRRRKGEKVKPVGDPVEHWKKYAKGLSTIVFSASVNDSIAVVQRYRDAGISAEHIDADTPEDEREEVFERSRKGETKIIANVGVCVEGVDLPWLACCQILRGCNSLVLFTQASGRIMRAFPGKSHGILLDHSGACHEFGLPHWDREWVLEDERANKAKNKIPKDKKPVCCMKCGLVFSAKPACPECGHVLPRKKRRSLLPTAHNGDGILTEFSASQATIISQGAMDRLWSKILYIGKAKGWPMRRCAAVFKSEAKVLPWEAGLTAPLPRRTQWSMFAADWLLMGK